MDAATLIRYDFKTKIYMMNVNHQIIVKYEQLNKLGCNHLLEFQDYIFIQVSTFVISLLRTKLSFSSTTIGSALLCRSILESLALLKMYESNDIEKENVELLLFYSFICEYRIYKKYLNLDGDVFDFEQITRNYNSAKDYFKRFSTTKVLKKKLSWLKKFNSYADLVKKYHPEHYNDYQFFSILIHPNNYQYSEEFYGGIFIDKYITFSLLRCIEYFPIDTVEFKYDENYILSIMNSGENKELSKNSTILKSTLIDLGKKLEGEFNNNLQSSFYFTIANLLEECYVDIVFGFKEVVAAKFKPLLEMISVMYQSLMEIGTEFHRVFVVHTKYKMLKVLNNEFNVEDEYKEFDQIFGSVEDFIDYLNSDIGINGFTSINQLVFNCVDKLVIDKKLNSMIKMIYDESQSLSHGNCYMLQCNFGVWDNSYISIDYFLLLLQKCIGIHQSYFEYYKKNEGEKNYNKIIYDFKKTNKIINKIREKNNILFAKGFNLHGPIK